MPIFNARLEERSAGADAEREKASRRGGSSGRSSPSPSRRATCGGGFMELGPARRRRPSLSGYLRAWAAYHGAVPDSVERQKVPDRQPACGEDGRWLERWLE